VVYQPLSDDFFKSFFQTPSPVIPTAAENSSVSADPALIDPSKPKLPNAQPGAPASSPSFTRPRPSLPEKPPEELDWRRIGIGVAIAIFMIAILGGVLWIFVRPSVQDSSITIHSEPDGVKVTIDELMTAQTPFHMGNISQGHYLVHFEKEGYQTLTQQLDVLPGQSIQFTVHLQPVQTFSSTELNLENVQSLLNKGQLVQAGRIAAALLAKNPGQAEVLQIQQEIRKRLMTQANKAMAASHWDEARSAWEKLFQLFPSDPDIQRQLRETRSRQKKETDTTKNSAATTQARIQTMREQIQTALRQGNYLPPASENALDAIHQLASLAPGDALVKEATEQIQREWLAQVSRKIQAKSLEEARGMLRQYQSFFVESAEFRNLRDTLRNEESKQLDQKSSLIRLAETAYSTGHYVIPANENAVTLANRVLNSDPQNQRMLAIKKDSLAKALALARDDVVRWKFDDASSLFSAILSFAAIENHFLFDVSQIKSEAEKVEFKSFAVNHNHTIVGNCSGKLRVNSIVVTYVPSGDSKDGFIERVADIQQLESGDKLKLKFPLKLFKFEAKGAENKEDNRQKIQQMYLTLRRVAPTAR
jgi:hypothetical protein